MLLFNRLFIAVATPSSYFNTSNVTIQLQQFHLCAIVRYISIHLMLLFNILTSPVKKLYSYFNTSNVTIQLYCIWSSKPSNRHFNTSNVTIQLTQVTQKQSCKGISIHLMLLFNQQI